MNELLLQIYGGSLRLVHDVIVLRNHSQELFCRFTPEESIAFGVLTKALREHKVFGHTVQLPDSDISIGWHGEPGEYLIRVNKGPGRREMSIGKQGRDLVMRRLVDNIGISEHHQRRSCYEWQAERKQLIRRISNPRLRSANKREG